MPNAYGRAFTTANFLSNLAALKAINFGSADPAGVWFVVPNQTTNNVEIWVWEPTSTATTNETDVVRPDSVIPGSPGRCLQRLKFDSSSLGGILAAIAALNTAGLIERTAGGSVTTATVTSYIKGLLDDASDSAARATLGLDQINNTSDVNKPISSATQTALNLKANLASPALTGTPTVPTAAAGTNTTQAASTAFVSNAVANLLNSAPAVLDTLGELSAALGNDPNFATTIANSIGLKANIASPTFTGIATIGGSLVLPSAATTGAGTIWRNVNNLEFKDNANTTQILLNSGGNLSNLANRQTALNNLAGAVTTNRFLKGNGTNIGLGQVDLATADITGNLPIANGTNFVAISGNQTGIAGNKTFTGIVNFSNTTQSTSITTGGVTYAGGVGIAGNLFLGGLLNTNGQIQFPTTKSPSTNVNILDDYEEGTFLPIVVGITTEGEATYSQQVGTFIKIGRLIFFVLEVIWSAHTGTGSLRIGGLPYLQSTNRLAPVSIWLTGYSYTAGSTLEAVVNNAIINGVNQGIIQFHLIPSGGGNVTTAVPLSATGRFVISGFYFTTS